MNWLRTRLQRWLDRKTQETLRLKEKLQTVADVSEQKDITIGEFRQQAEQALEEMDKQAESETHP